MSKICCIENGVVSPKGSSCSMILRSACSHGHSHRNSFVKEHSSSSHKRKHNSSIASKSPQNGYSLLNGLHESFEINHKTNQKVLEVSSSVVSCVKELHFSQLSLSDLQDSYIFNNSNHAKCSSDYCSATESDINSSESLEATSDMNTRRYVRSPHPSVRSLSDSEGESDISVQRISRLTRKSVSKNYNANQNLVSQRETDNLLHNNASYIGNHSYSTNSHSSKYTGTSDSDTVHSFMTDSSVLNTSSSALLSLFDRIRFFLWNSTYLSLLRCMQFDLWLLSRCKNIGRTKIIPILLLPLIFWLVLGAYESSPSPSELLSPVTELVSTVISSFLSFLSSIFSFVCILFTREAVEDGVSESSNEAGLLALLPSLSSFGALFSGFFSSAIVEREYDLKKHNPHLKEEIHLVVDSDTVSRSSQPSEELLALYKLKDELKELKLNIQQIEADKLMYQKIHSDISDLHFKFETLSKTLTTKEKDSIERYQKEQSDRDEKLLAVTNEYKNNIDILKDNLKVLESKLSIYEDLKKCCNKNQDLAALIERNIILAFKEILDGDVNSKYNFFSEWLNSKFFNHEKLMREINASLREHKSSYTEATMDFGKVMQVVESTVMKHVDSLKRNLSEFNSYSHSTYSEDFFSDDKIRKIVKEAIMLYDADKIGQVDYALESGGGSVLGTRCSETYVEKYGKISLFGVPFWTYSNSPRTAIQPDVQPGRCWAFKGSQGFLVLQLSATIYPTGFTLEHIPVSLSPAGSIDSAPKNFSVWGLDSEKDNKGNLLGEYFYDINGDPLQYYAVKIPSSKPYSYIELQIHSNHGNMEYTCLYRFRVHGKRSY